MTRARDGGTVLASRRYRLREFENGLRRERAKHVRVGQRWCPKKARAALVKEKGTAFHKARL